MEKSHHLLLLVKRGQKLLTSDVTWHDFSDTHKLFHLCCVCVTYSYPYLAKMKAEATTRHTQTRDLPTFSSLFLRWQNLWSRWWRRCQPSSYCVFQLSSQAKTGFSSDSGSDIAAWGASTVSPTYYTVVPLFGMREKGRITHCVWMIPHAILQKLTAGEVWDDDHWAPNLINVSAEFLVTELAQCNSSCLTTIWIMQASCLLLKPTFFLHKKGGKVHCFCQKVIIFIDALNFENRGRKPGKLEFSITFSDFQMEAESILITPLI